MSKKVENTRVKGGMKRYREQYAGQVTRRDNIGTLTKPKLDLPPDPDDVMPEPTRIPTSKKRGMVAAWVTIQIIAIGGLIGYTLVRKGDQATLRPGPPMMPPPEEIYGSNTTPPRPVVVAADPEELVTAIQLPVSYKVEQADTWESIAEAKSITLEQLRAANEKISDLHIGLEIIIPPPQHIVTATETTPKVTPKEIATQTVPGAGEKQFALNEENPGYGKLLNVTRPDEQLAIAPRTTIPPAQIQIQRQDPIVATEPPVETPVQIPNTAGLDRYIPPPRTVAPEPPAEVAPAPPAKTIPKARIVDQTPRPPKARIVTESGLRQTGSAQTVSGVGSNKRLSHLVRRGDTLFSVAQRMGISVDELKSLNGLRSDQIQDGKTLIGPYVE